MLDEKPPSDRTGTTKGVKILPNKEGGVEIIDSKTTTEPPPVEITEGEGDRDS